MKKFVFFSMFLSLIFSAGYVQAQEISMELSKPNMKGSRPLMEVIDKRQSMREFSGREIDKQVLSDVLWAAWGFNSGGKRTIPTARNQQNLDVYVFMADGVWKYNPKESKLILISNTDYRNLLAKQEYVMDAPVSLVYVGSDPVNSPLHAGSSYQNVSLYAASKGLSAVVRGLIDKEAIKRQLNLADEEEVITSITIGWRK